MSPGQVVSKLRFMKYVISAAKIVALKRRNRNKILMEITGMKNLYKCPIIIGLGEKMVLGIGEGKIDLELGSHDVASGGIINGTLLLELNAPKKARELRVELIGEQWQTRAGKRRKVQVYKFKKSLGGAQTYQGGQYKFELKAPQKTELEKKVEGGIAGALMGAAKMLGMVSPIEWYVVGTLDLGMSLDITKKVQIAIL